MAYDKATIGTSSIEFICDNTDELMRGIVILGRHIKKSHAEKQSWDF